MAYKIVACALETPADVDRIETTAVYYSDGKFFLEIYKKGTCVFPLVTSGNEVEGGWKRLAEVAEKSIHFTVREMDDHKYVFGLAIRCLQLFSVTSLTRWPAKSATKPQLCHQMNCSSESPVHQTNICTSVFLPGLAYWQISKGLHL